MATVSKSEFARRRNVTPGRVTQWISAGQISGAALVGDGRSAQIDEAIAIEQLRRTRHIDQAHSMNGLGTRLELDPAAPPATPHSEAAPSASSSAPPPPIVDSVESKIAAARLEGLERANRRAAIDEAQELGDLVAASVARGQATREIGRTIARVEGSLADLANAIAAEFKLAQRDVLHLLRAKWREIRRAAALEARERAEPMPERVGHEVGDQ
jgi:hypothetical protein